MSGDPNNADETRKLWRGTQAEYEMAMSRVPTKVNESMIASALDATNPRGALSTEEIVAERFAKQLAADKFTDDGLAAYSHLLEDSDPHMETFLAAVQRRYARNPKIWNELRPKLNTKLYAFVHAMVAHLGSGKRAPGGMIFGEVGKILSDPAMRLSELRHYPDNIRNALRKLDEKFGPKKVFCV